MGENCTLRPVIPGRPEKLAKTFITESLLVVKHTLRASVSASNVSFRAVPSVITLRRHLWLH